MRARWATWLWRRRVVVLAILLLAGLAGKTLYQKSPSKGKGWPWELGATNEQQDRADSAAEQHIAAARARPSSRDAVSQPARRAPPPLPPPPPAPPPVPVSADTADMLVSAALPPTPHSTPQQHPTIHPAHLHRCSVLTRIIRTTCTARTARTARNASAGTHASSDVSLGHATAVHGAARIPNEGEHVPTVRL